MASWPTNDTPVLARTLQRIKEREPTYGSKLEAELARRDAAFFERAERFLARFEKFLAAQGKPLEHGIDCHLKLRIAMKQERMDFLRSGRYASSSFAEVEQRVYANPEIMEYYMYGLVFSQFLWKEQYARLEFFCNGLPLYRTQIDSYLELGGGHAMYISSAADILQPDTHFELIDISATSIDVARAMSPNDRIQYHLCNVFDFPAERKYDFVVAGEILEHLEEPRKLLARIRDMLTPRGHAFISTPVNAPTVDHIHLFNHAREIRDMLRSEGYLIESEATRYAEDVPEAQAEKLKVAQMFAAFVRVEQAPADSA
ncbi:MAG: class I SAM-dependent methyltransferase [Acidobacteriia bacterium]|nr:class I SAM-dependent methyltransferase [Terriglobia bacterium]